MARISTGYGMRHRLISNAFIIYFNLSHDDYRLSDDV